MIVLPLHTFLDWNLDCLDSKPKSHVNIISGRFCCGTTITYCTVLDHYYTLHNAKPPLCSEIFSYPYPHDSIASILVRLLGCLPSFWGYEAPQNQTSSLFKRLSDNDPTFILSSSWIFCLNNYFYMTSFNTIYFERSDFSIELLQGSWFYQCNWTERSSNWFGRE